VKTYASDEGRCIKTAAAFLKGFLSIEGELAPIISSMVMADSKAQSKLTSIKDFSIAPVRKIIRLWLMSYRNG
jgi:hypothetical protein